MKRAHECFSFVICNEGYTIERYIHGWDASYNDIQPWDFYNIPKVFGGQDGYKGYRVKTRDELSQLFADQDFCTSDKLRVSWKFLFMAGELTWTNADFSLLNCTCPETTPRPL